MVMPPVTPAALPSAAAPAPPPPANTVPSGTGVAPKPGYKIGASGNAVETVPHRIGGILGRIGGYGLSILDPALASVIPSTPLGRIAAEKRDLARQNIESEIGLRKAETEAAAAKPAESKQTLDDIIGARTQYLVSKGQDIGKDPVLQQLNQEKQELEKPPAPEKAEDYKAYSVPGNPNPVLARETKGGDLITRDGSPLPKDATPYQKLAEEGRPVAGMVNGKPAFGVWDQTKGWLDPQTKQPIQGFSPPPSFAETGLYEPVTDANGRTVKFDKRTGNISPVGGANAAPVLSPDQSKELQTVEEAGRNADTQLRVMKENLPDALKGDQQAQLSIVANHIGMTLGQQKGARINQAVWNEAIQSAPLLGRVKARWGPDGYLMGVTLTPDQVHQMVRLGEQRRAAVWNQVKDTMTQFGATDFSHVIPKDVLDATPETEPERPANVPKNYIYDANGPQGAGYYKPKPKAKK